MQLGSRNKRYKIYNAFCLFKAGEVEVDDGFVEKNWTEEKMQFHHFVNIIKKKYI